MNNLILLIDFHKDSLDNYTQILTKTCKGHSHSEDGQADIHFTASIYQFILGVKMMSVDFRQLIFKIPGYITGSAYLFIL